MRRRSSPLSRLTATVAAAALSAGLFTTVPSVAAAGQLGGETTYLGLEGEGDKVVALSDALRWDLNQRGRDDGNTMSLAELKLTMGCGDDDLACFAQGGETLGSTELVFGSMTKVGDKWRVTLQALDVGSGELTNQIERELSGDDLSDVNLGKTAASLINELYKIAPSTEELPPDEGGGEGEGGGEEGGGEEGGEETTADAPPGGELIWGPYSPRPTWKKVGVGVSGALALVSLGTAIGTTVAIGPNGPVRKDLIKAAEDSLNDGKGSNDVDPNSDADLCELARTPPDPSKPDEVTNAAVSRVCIKADNLANLATVSWVATGVFVVSTAVFTTLLFVHRGDPGVAAMRKHDIRFGGTPLRDGGFLLGGSFDF